MHFPLSRLFRIITRVSVNSCERNARVDTRVRPADGRKIAAPPRCALLRWLARRFRVRVKFIITSAMLNYYYVAFAGVSGAAALKFLINEMCTIDYLIRRCGAS